MTLALGLALALPAASLAQRGVRPASQAAAPPPAFFQSLYAPAEMQGRQAVVETSAGTIVIQLFPEVAP
ncbi:MAG: hypothetical protein ABI652_09060, partial [Acidobacteriota bacterium]